MKVLKFGGSSVATAETIQKVIKIVKNASKANRLAVVVSAFGGVTDNLLESGNEACSAKTSYKERLDVIEKLHLNMVRELLPVNHQSLVLGQVKKMLNDLESTLEGVFLINEISPRTSDRIEAS
jgi:aspartokinase/homoserine dehydrogenase 1